MEFISPEIMASNFFGNTVFEYLFFVVFFVLLITAMKIFKFVIVSRLKQLFEKTENDLDDIFIHFIDSISWYFYIIVSLFISIQLLIVPAFINVVLEYLLIIAVVYYSVKAFQEVIDFGTKKLIEKADKNNINWN